MPKGVNTHHHAKGGKEGLKAPMGNSHWEKKEPCLETSDLKYIQNNMGNPEELSASVTALAGYAKKHKMKY
jgi:hypothetical protein